MDILDKKTLEQEFANDFSAPIFPILGELYLKEKDYKRAEKVCEIGLKHDPENINGYYILSKIYLYNNKLNDAESMLKIIIKKNPLHINALKLLIEIQKQLNKSKKIRLKYIEKLFEIFPDDTKLEKKINSMKTSYPKKKEKNTYTKPNNKNVNIQKNINFNVAPNMATLTFVDILKQQKHYHEALHVLSIIESQSSQTKKIQKIKSDIKKLLAQSD